MESINKAWNELTKKEIIKLLEDDEVVQELRKITERYISFELCAGAIISIMKGEKPKDYDVFGLSHEKLTRAGAVFSHSSRTADTYTLNNSVIQTLKIGRHEFEYTISEFYAKITDNKH